MYPGTFELTTQQVNAYIHTDRQICTDIHRLTYLCIHKYLYMCLYVYVYVYIHTCKNKYNKKQSKWRARAT